MTVNANKFAFHDVETLQQFSPVVDVIRYSYGNEVADAFAKELVDKQFPIRIASPLTSSFTWQDAVQELDVNLTTVDYVEAHRSYIEHEEYGYDYSSVAFLKRVEELRELGTATEFTPDGKTIVKPAFIPEPAAEPVETSPLSKDFQVGGDHYSKLTIQPWDVMRETLGHDAFCGFLHGNVIKYVMRDKNGVEDLKKAQHYLSVLIAEIEGDDDGQA